MATSKDGSVDVCVIGAGYVGLVAAACLAETGHRVSCVDQDAAKVAALNDGHVPIYETGLKGLVDRNRGRGRLRFTGSIAEAMRDATVAFITVGTPGRRDGGADTRAVHQVAAEVVAAASRPLLLVLKSTVPVGTNARVREAAAGTSTVVVSNPEFLREGAAVEDFLRPARIVVGAADVPSVRDRVETLYAAHMARGVPLCWMSPESAELTKYAANTALAMRVSFANEVAALSEATGASAPEVLRAVGLDPRIGSDFLLPGAGYGGSCFPKDVKALVHMGEQHGVPMRLASATDEVNATQARRLVDRLQTHMNDFEHKRVALWGVAFKPGTNDIREAPALVSIKRLLDLGAEVRAHDPKALDALRNAFGDVGCFEDAYEAANEADALLVHTEWPEYAGADLGRLKSVMRRPLVLDGRNVWRGRGLSALGFEYEGVG